MYSLVINVAIDVIKAELLAIDIPILGLTIDDVEDTILDLDPFKISEIIKDIFFLFKLSYNFLEYSLSLFLIKLDLHFSSFDMTFFIKQRILIYFL